MVTINNLSSTTSIAAGDLLPVYSSANSDTRKASMTTLLEFVEANFASPEFTVQTAAPTATGFTTTIAAATTNLWLILSPTGTFAAGTIVLPPVADCFDGQQIMITTSQAITVLTVTLNGATAQGVPTSLLAGGFFALRFNTLQQKWFCVAQSLGATSTFTDITLTSGTIKDLNGSTALQLTRNYVDPGPAVNNVTITNRAAGSSPSISATGSDTNIGLTISSKGNSALTLNAVGGNCAIVATTITLGGTVAGMTSSADVGITGKATTTLGVTVPAGTVDGLPAAASNTNTIRIVTDANATTAGAVVVGGGANRLLVASDGAAWRIG